MRKIVIAYSGRAGMENRIKKNQKHPTMRHSQLPQV